VKGLIEIKSLMTIHSHKHSWYLIFSVRHVYQKDQGYQRRFQHIIRGRNEKIKTTWTLTLLGKTSITYRKTQLKLMTLYGISSKDSNNDNIYELTDKHITLLNHQIPHITLIPNEATTFGKRNHFDTWNVT